VCRYVHSFNSETQRGLLATERDAELPTILLAANIGGDSDSVASIGGAVAGAIRPETVNEEWFHAVRRTNSQDLVEAATLLAALRSSNSCEFAFIGQSGNDRQPVVTRSTLHD
jgi:outer membrane lipoprotein SlyB